MYLNYQHKDRTGALISQLKGLALDLEFHHRTEQQIGDVHADYPNLRKLALDCLISHGRLRSGEVDRVEAAGFNIIKLKNSDRLIISTQHGQVEFNIDNPEADHILKRLERRVSIPGNPLRSSRLLEA